MSTDEQEDELEAHIDEEEAKANQAVRNAVCTICRIVWVDVLNGEDTCPECLRSQ